MNVREHRRDNKKKWTTQVTQDEENTEGTIKQVTQDEENKTNTQYVLDTTIREQTQIE